MYIYIYILHNIYILHIYIIYITYICIYIYIHTYIYIYVKSNILNANNKMSNIVLPAWAFNAAAHKGLSSPHGLFPVPESYCTHMGVHHCRSKTLFKHTQPLVFLPPKYIVSA